MRRLYFLMLCIVSFSRVSAQVELSKEEKQRRQNNIDAANPFKQFGYNAKVATLSKGKYLEVHDLDSIVTIGSVRFHVEKMKIVGVVVPDSTYREFARPIGDIASRWLSPDPLAEEYPNWTPYRFGFNNPIRYNDPTGLLENDDVIIKGSESQTAFNELQSSVSGELTLSMDNNGKVTYTQNTEGPLTADATQLVNAINDSSITVNVIAENTKTTSSGNLYVGGAFMGNTVTVGVFPLVSTVSTLQEINPNVLSIADNYFGTSGSLTLHEVTESYQGALISQQSGVSAGMATQADVANPNSVYNRAHNAATPQKFPIYRNVYDAQGNILQSPYTNAVRAEFFVQQGSRTPQTILIYP